MARFNPTYAFTMLDPDWESDFPTPAETVAPLQRCAERLEAEEEHIGLIVATILLDSYPAAIDAALKTEQRK